MPETRCAYGFSCASMLLEPGLEAENCPNRNTCGTIRELTEDERVEMRIARIENNRRIIEEISVTPDYAAQMLLDSRGLPQTVESLGLTVSIAALKQQIADIESILEQAEVEYIAPPEIEAHRYAVTRPFGTYWYNKLTCKKAIFPPSIKKQNVKVLHLSKDTDARNIKARMGIERRNQLLAAKTKIENATKLLNQAAAGISEDAAIQSLAEKKII